MKSLKLSLVVLIAFMALGCENAELVSCQEQNQVLTADLSKVQADVEKANKDLEAYKIESEDMQTKAMGAITTMLQKQEVANKKLNAAASQTKKKAFEVTKQLDVAKKANSDLKAKNKALAAKLETAKAANAALTAKVAKLELEKAPDAEVEAVNDN